MSIFWLSHILVSLVFFDVLNVVRCCRYRFIDLLTSTRNFLERFHKESTFWSFLGHFMRSIEIKYRTCKYKVFISEVGRYLVCLSEILLGNVCLDRNPSPMVLKPFVLACSKIKELFRVDDTPSNEKMRGITWDDQLAPGCQLFFKGGWKLKIVVLRYANFQWGSP